jgi:hypothetical protein
MRGHDAGREWPDEPQRVAATVDEMRERILVQGSGPGGALFVFCGECGKES